MSQRKRYPRLAAWLLPAAALMITSSGASAASNADLEQRIQKLEQRVLQQQQQQQLQTAIPKADAKTPPTKDAANKKAGMVVGNTQFKIGGYVKMDAIHSDYSHAAGGIPTNRGRAFYVPGLVPVGGERDHDSATDFLARETRLNVGTSTAIGNSTVKSFIELDLYGESYDEAGSGNRERLTNSGDLRVRHAFLEWDDGKHNKWLFGQTWSNFMDLAAFPETLDFIGPVDGMVFVRQTQARWTHGPLSISLENPNSTITPNGGGRIANDKDKLPDFTARYTLPLANDRGHLSAAALLREVRVNDVSAHDKTFGYAASVSGKVNFNSANDVRFQLNWGDGIGRYLGLNSANGAVIDNDRELSSIKAYGGYLSLRHLWNDKWRSNLAYSYFNADNNTRNTGLGVTQSSSSVHANLIYQVFDPLSLGVELIHANREIESGDRGSLNRVQFSAKYVFGFGG